MTFRLLGLAVFFLAFQFPSSIAAGHAAETVEGDSSLPNLSVDDLLVLLGSPGLQILDLRDGTASGLGESDAPPRFRAGHIPGALPWNLGLDPTRARSQESALAELSTVGARSNHPISPSDELVIYGDDDDDPRIAAAISLAQRAGRKARALTGGWKAWTAHADASIVEIVDALTLAQRLKVGNPELRRDQPSPNLPVFDLRPKDAARRRRLPGAAILDGDALDLALPAALVASWPEFDRTLDSIAFYCYGRTCIRSREAGMAAAQLGYRHILWFRDGMPGWEQAGLPVFGDEVPKGLSGSR